MFFIYFIFCSVKFSIDQSSKQQSLVNNVEKPQQWSKNKREIMEKGILKYNIAVTILEKQNYSKSFFFASKSTLEH